MNELHEETFVVKKSFREKLNTHKVYVVPIALIGIAVAIVLGAYSLTSLLQERGAAEHETLDDTLTPEKNTSDSGYLYISGDYLPDPDPVNIYALEIATGDISPVTSGGVNYDFAFSNDTYMLAFSELPIETVPEDAEPIAPVWYDMNSLEYGVVPVPIGWNKSGLTIAEENGVLAYQFMFAPQGEEDTGSEQMNVAIHTISSGATGIIENAWSPQLIEKGNTILYVTTDGVYRWGNEENSEPELFLADDSFDYINTHITALPKSNALVVSSDASDTYKVLVYADDAYTQIIDVIEITAEDSTFGTAVESVDGTSYYIIRYLVTDEVVIEQRNLDEEDVIATITLDDFDVYSLSIDALLAELVTTRSIE